VLETAKEQQSIEIGALLDQSNYSENIQKPLPKVDLNECNSRTAIKNSRNNVIMAQS